MAEQISRTVRRHEFGGPEVLQIEKAMVASPSPDQVHLAIRAIGLKRTEVTLRSGSSPQKPPLPATLGFEAAGVIEEVGLPLQVGMWEIVLLSSQPTALPNIHSTDNSRWFRPLAGGHPEQPDL
jgi:hypothetical protein